MRIAAHTVIIATGVLGLIGSALATEIPGPTSKRFFQATPPMWNPRALKADGTALYRRPRGGMMHGKWDIKGNTLCAQWKERSGTGRVRYDKTGDVVTVIDVKRRKTRAKIVKTAPGN